MSGTGVGGGMELDLDPLVAVVASGRVRFLRVRVGGTEFVYSADSGTVTVPPPPLAPAPTGPGPGPGPTPAAAPPRSAPSDGFASVPQPGADSDVVAPMAGIFHHTSAPGAAPYVVAGQRVEPATTVGLMESMKVFTTVEAAISGVVMAVLVPSGQAVAKGQPLVRIRPADDAGTGEQA